jgi:DNA topoisomerase-1
MSKTLIIVESKSKIATIQKILGSGYIGGASFGHIQDLPPKEMGIDLENNFEPTYEIIDRQKANVNALKKLSKSCDVTLLAGDDDNEGMFINYSLAEHLKLKKPKRLVYHEITKSALLKAIKNPQDIDMNIVHAQQCRRVIDRLCGFELSPMLQKVMGSFGLSAGRCQTVVNRLIVEREEVIDEFYKKGADNYHKVTGYFSFTPKFKNMLPSVLYEVGKKEDDTDEEEEEEDDSSDDSSDDDKSGELKGAICKLGKNDTSQPSKEVKTFLRRCKKSDFTVQCVFNKTKISQPCAPFQTSSLQQESSNKLGFSPKRTMEIAQKLYEKGFITYMRTDSISLSKEWIDKLEGFVKDTYGKKYHNRKEWSDKKSATGGAHEAIRVTNLDKTPDDDDFDTPEQKKLYGLIWKRTVASQMTAAKYNVVNIQIVGSKIDGYFFLTKIEKLLFEGYLKVYGKVSDITENNDDDVVEHDENFKLPEEDDSVYMKSIVAVQQYAKPISRYSEATLVSAMKKYGIGRPATYSSFSAKIQEREYVKLGNIEGKKMPSYTLQIHNDKDEIEETKKTIMMGKETKRLYPTELGKTINTFMMKHFAEIVDYKFTAKIEKDLELIASGEKVWQKVVKKFYDQFHPKIEALLEKYKDNGANFMNKDDKLIDEDDEFKYIAGKRKHGMVVMKVAVDGGSKAKIQYAPLKDCDNIDLLKLKDVEKLFEFPKNLGKHEKKDVVLKKGQYGLYLVWNNNNYNLNNKTTNEDNKASSKEESEKNGYGEDITLEEAIEYIKEKSKGVFCDKTNQYKILNGEFGPYINCKELKKNPKISNAGLPKDFDMDTIDELTLEDVQQLYTKALAFKKERYSNGINNTTKKPVKKITKSTKKAVIKKGTSKKSKSA